MAHRSPGESRTGLYPTLPGVSLGACRGLGGAVFQILRNFYRTDNIPFTFVSDEFNGVTLDRDGNVSAPFFRMSLL